MRFTDIPAKLQLPFASGADPTNVHTIPVSDPGGGLASLTLGFPPTAFLPVGAGGIPPWGQDVNGLMLQVTAWSRWVAAGGMVTFDPVFSAAVGGYPARALVASTAIGQMWISLIDNNTVDPDSVGQTTWFSPFDQIKSIIAARQSLFAQFVTRGSYNYVVPAYITSLPFLMIGAGGNGGAGGGGAGGGGGGGAYARGIFPVTPGETLIVSVGGGAVISSSLYRGTTALVEAGNGTNGSIGSSSTVGTGGAGGVTNAHGLLTCLGVSGGGGSYGVYEEGVHYISFGGTAWGGSSPVITSGSALIGYLDGSAGNLFGGGGAGAVGTGAGGLGADGLVFIGG